MTLTQEDINAILVALQPRFAQIDFRFEELTRSIADLAHSHNKRLTAIEVRLDSIEYKLGQIAVFVPYENAYVIPPIRKQN